MEWALAWESGVLVLTFCILIHTFGLNIVGSLIQPEEVKKRTGTISVLFSILITAFVALTTALRPIAWVTTQRFLEVFALGSLRDLPDGRREPFWLENIRFKIASLLELRDGCLTQALECPSPP